MITEIVTFDLPPGMTRERLRAMYRETAPDWRVNPDLLRKNYLHDPAQGIGGGVYLWRDRDAVARWHDAAFRARVERRFGSPPRILVFETPVLVDNLLGRILEADPADAEAAGAKLPGRGAAGEAR